VTLYYKHVSQTDRFLDSSAVAVTDENRLKFLSQKPVSQIKVSLSISQIDIEAYLLLSSGAKTVVFDP
jgi:hypothetical protein